MVQRQTRRTFIREAGVTTATLPFIWNLASLGFAKPNRRKQRLIIMFSPNGVVPTQFWPKEQGTAFQLPPILSPLEPFKDRTLVLNGICNKVRGDGDSHMRGMSCLLTGIELFPGNIQGGSHTPAGWPRGLSIDQEIKNYFQDRADTQTRFGSLEFGVAVPHRADPWTRMVYAGPNKPLVPIDDPYQMLRHMYGQVQDQKSLKIVLDDVCKDLKKIRTMVSAEDRKLLEEHETFVREMEKELQASQIDSSKFPTPFLDKGVKNVNDNIPKLSRMQIDLLVNGLVCDFMRVATLQYTNSVGSSHMRWIGIDESHHELSHHPDSNKESQKMLTKINTWFCEQLTYLVQKLADTPEPDGDGCLLDNTTVIWTNELGKGNSHTLNNIPFVLVGGGMRFRMGRSLRYKNIAHNRLHLSLAHAVGHRLKTFGKPKLCDGGVLPDLV